MDQQRFDAALRALQSGTTRRRGLAAALGVMLGGAGLDTAANGANRHAATGRPETSGPCGDGSARSNRCAKNSDCCTKYCADGSCRCKPNWMTCSKSEHCCSGSCVDGHCDGGCKDAGGRCEEQFNCCDGMDCITGVCTKSRTASCTRQNCTGCCSGTMCRIGSVSRACGTKGGRCQQCGTGTQCVKGTCTGGGGGSCSAATCPSGCCAGTTCKPGTSDNACGAGGSSCTACPAGNSCQSHICQPTCNASTCPNGCCDGGACVAGTDAAACGAGGAVCAVCAGEAKPFCTSNVCIAGTWTNQTTFGTPGASSGNLNSPFGVWVTSDELTVYVADEQNSRISIWTRPDTTTNATAWTNLTTFGSYGAGPSQFGNPSAVSVTASGLTAAIADWENHRVSIWTRSDAASTSWSNQTTFGSDGTGPSNLTNPQGVFMAADGLTIWVSDSGNSRISIWTRPDATSANWANQTTFGSGSLAYPYGIFVSADGLTAWIADHNNSRISIWSRVDAASTTWTNQSNFGSFGTGPTNLKLADGVWASSDGLSAWVADSGNHRVSIWTRASATSTTWDHLDNFGSYGSTTSEFAQPRSVVVASDGLTAWIGDYSNNRVSIWTQS